MDEQALAGIYPGHKCGWKHVTDNGEDLLEAVVNIPEETLLIMDFDGTLAPIVDDPEDSRLLPEAAEALGRLGNRFARIAVVTGRDARTVVRIGQLDHVAGLERVIVLGHYGDERWDGETGDFSAPDEPVEVATARQRIEELLETEESAGRDVEGIQLEDKAGRSIGVHVRQAADPHQVRQWLEEPLREIAQDLGLHIEPGRNVIELRSSTTSKGDAVRHLVGEVQPRVVLMAGDDLGDVPAFKALQELRSEDLFTGCIVSGSDEEPAVDQYADIRCDGPEGVASLLNAMADALGDPTEP